jgi:diguanylate cyclase (GGDEF)-like protein
MFNILTGQSMGSEISMKKPMVLVVDDDITTVKFIAQAIKSEYEVIFALSAIECLQKASQAVKPDLILLDVKMPKVDGFEICDTLKSTPETQHIPVVFITSAKLASDQVKGFELGATDYLTKPIDTKILKARLRAHIRQSTDLKSLEALVLTDVLTGVANRRKFNEAICSDWKLAVRDKSPISLLMIDIDDFKRFNDHYGHPKGDKCLIAVANTLQKTVERPIDMVARVGGEEFVILLPNTDLEGAEFIAQKVLDEIRLLEYPHAESSVRDIVTLSIGVSCAEPCIEDEPELLIQAADKGLYKAKHDGKDRYRIEHIVEE